MGKDLPPSSCEEEIRNDIENLNEEVEIEKKNSNDKSKSDPQLVEAQKCKREEEEPSEYTPLAPYPQRLKKKHDYKSQEILELFKHVKINYNSWMRLIMFLFMLNT